MTKPKTTRKPTERVGKARGGRPTRAEALRKAIAAVGVDPDLVDPKRVLAGIAVDETAPPTARVAAAKALLAANVAQLPPVHVAPEEVPEDDVLSRRALALMALGARPQ
jgi:hypothetical protein